MERKTKIKFTDFECNLLINGMNEFRNMLRRDYLPRMLMTYSLKSLISAKIKCGDIMTNIIEEFYYGNIEPQELNSEITPKLKKKLSSLAEKEEQLTAMLNGEEKEMFLNFVSAYTEFSTISNSDSFISGFRLGAKFTYDTFIGNAKG